ncbi:Site-specific recombinase XerD, partial [human gut metagenome]
MAVSKDIEKGTWTSQVWVEDWQGKKKHKKKRGFATKKEALEWEHSILLAAKADMNMKLADFVDLYFRDKETELKARTVRNKRYMIEQHVAPMLGDKPMDGITPADIIQWQNYIRSKGFKETYQRMLQNQLTALFTHATKIYNLKDNPCAKVKRIGKADADKKQLQFWTLDEF